MSEDPESDRLRTIRASHIEEPPSLLSPGPRIIGDTPEPETSVYFSEFLMERHGGVYVNMNEYWGNDVGLVNGEGKLKAFIFPRPSPRFQSFPGGQLPLLRNVLEKWTELVENGTWQVDKIGVMGGTEALSGAEANPRLLLDKSKAS